MAGDLEATRDAIRLSRVEDLLGQARSLIDKDELLRARPLLLDLQRLVPQNTAVRNMLRELQGRLTQQPPFQTSTSARDDAGTLNGNAQQHPDNPTSPSPREAVAGVRDLPVGNGAISPEDQRAAAFQEEERRNRIIEQIVVEIRAQAERGHAVRALELVERSLQRAPRNAALLALQAEVQAQVHAEAQAQVVRSGIPADAPEPPHPPVSEVPVAEAAVVPAAFHSAITPEPPHDFLPVRDQPPSVLEAEPVSFSPALVHVGSQANPLDVASGEVTIDELTPASSPIPAASGTQDVLDQGAAPPSAAHEGGVEPALTGSDPVQIALAPPISSAVPPAEASTSFTATSSFKPPFAPTTSNAKAPIAPPVAPHIPSTPHSEAPLAVPEALPARRSLQPKVIFLGTVVAGLVVAILLLALGHHRSPAPLPLTYAQLVASPYAQVLQVRSANGQSVPLPPGDHTTPLRLNALPAGNYAVNFQEANGQSSEVHCAIDAQQHLCSGPQTPLTDSDIQTVLNGGSRP